MAQRKSSKYNEYRELVIEGQYVILESFLTGYFIGKGVRSTKEIVLYNRKHDIKRESLSAIIKNWLAGHELVVHLLVRTDHHKALVSALKKAGETLGFEIKSDKKVKSASFEFEYNCYSQIHAGKIRNLVENTPPGVSLADYHPVEVVNEEAKGIEIYTPVHDYRISASGLIKGHLLGVLEIHRKVKNADLIEQGDIELHF